MTLIIAGSRGITDVKLVLDIVDTAILRWSGGPLVVTEVISGDAAEGPDSAALMKPWACVVTKMPADWKRHGIGAGFIRNRAMGVRAQALLAIWDGKSSGTGEMIRVMAKLAKPFCVVRPDMDKYLEAGGGK